MYYSATDFQFWLYWLVSIAALIVSCYFPGWLVTAKIKLESKLTETALSFVTGISLWALQGYIFGYAHIRWASYLYLVLVVFFIWKERKKFLHSLYLGWSELRELPKIILLAMLVAIIFQVYAHIGSGLIGAKGLGINFVNAADGMLHLTYIQSMVTNFPPLEPGFAGLKLLNYHYWSDLVFAEFARVWHLPIIHLFFQYIPLPLVVLTTVLWVQLIRYLKGNTWTILVGLFLLTFGADAAYMFALYFNRNWGATIPALDTGVTFIFNMPQMFSRLVLLGILLAFLQWLKTNSWKSIALLTFLAASLFGFKIYYGIYFVMGYGFYSLYIFISEIWKCIKDKISVASIFTRNTSLLVSWIVLLVAGAAIFLPNNSGTGGLQVEPLAWPKVFLSDQNFNYKDWWLRMQVYEEAKNYRNIGIYNSIAVIITLISVYGIRLLGIFPSKNTLRSLPRELLWFLLPTNIIFIIIGFVFFQVSISGGLNIYNFLITPILAFNLFTAFAITKVNDLTTKIFLVIIVGALCLPRTAIQLHEFYETYYSRHPSVVVSHDELALLTYLKTLGPGVVQADNHNQYESTAPYVSFFSDKSTFLGGDKLLETHSIDTKARKRIVDDIFNANSAKDVAALMKANNIRYLYITDSMYADNFINAAVNQSPLIIEKQNEAGMIISVK